MKTILLLLSTILISCGNDTGLVAITPYNDSSIKAEQVIQAARIAALEAKLNALETEFDTVVIDFGNSIDNIEDDFISLSQTISNNYNVLNDGLTLLAQKQLTPMKICTSGEYLLKNDSGVYAVYMVSNNFGTYLGKLAENVNYRSTDQVQATFKIVNNNIVCL